MITIFLGIIIAVLLVTVGIGIFLTGAFIAVAWKIVLPLIILLVIDIVVISLLFKRRHKKDE